MAKKTALITGISGQDGAYLARLLLQKDYRVVGLVRRTASQHEMLHRLQWLQVADRVEIFCGDLSDVSSLIRIIRDIQPHEIYNLAAQSFVHASWDQPLLTAGVTGMGALNLFEACRIIAPDARIYQASSSEMFGKIQEDVQTETTPFYPRSPYAVAKVFAHWSGINYRESYDMHISNGILFNHESPLRGIEFVTRKVTAAVAEIKSGKRDILEMGNMDAERDWGHAQDYVEAMWAMLQQDHADDYVIATGKTRSIRELCDVAFTVVGLQAGNYVQSNAKFFRPAEVDRLLGGADKAREKLGWQAQTSFEDMIGEMVEADLQRLKNA
ncbi:MAG: GDP-mannose 4,6-dehydratase [Pseudomonadota bacterium]